MVTIIDGTQSGSVVTFSSGEGSDSVLEGFTVTNGNATSGAGILCDNGSSPVIRDNLITLNLSDDLLSIGGGIACKLGSSPQILGNSVFLNAAVLGGGGICCDTGADALIEGNDIWGNAASVDGAGICCLAASPMIVNNNIFANTLAVDGGNGAGIHLTASNAEIINNTIFNNFSLAANSKGGGIGVATLSKPLVANTILWNNQADEGKEIHLSGFLLMPTLTIRNSDVEGGKDSVFVQSGAKLKWGKGMLDVDPAFKAIGPVTTDLHLTRESPLVNMGNNADAPAKDKDGEDRPYMGTADIGADEHTGTHALTVDELTLSEAVGGTLNFTLDGGSANAGRYYLIYATVSGTTPGTLLPGGEKTMPINWDLFTNIVANVNYPDSLVFEGFFGALDGVGRSTATFNTMGPVPGMAGEKVSFAYILKGFPWDFASNPVTVTVVP